MWHHCRTVWSEIKRKLFHLTALIYVVGIIYLPRKTYLALLTGGLASVLIFETLRLSRPAVNAWFIRRFGGLIREEERDRFTGVAWMLGGVALTVALLEPVELAVAALLYLILGDALASLVGTRVKGPAWPGTRKRLSGSAACLAACVLVGVVLLRPDYGWHGIFAGAVAATALERGFWNINDNFLIPVGSAIVFVLAYGVRPFAGLGL